MKKLLLSIALCLSTLTLFSQSLTNFGLYIINPTNCPYSITGYWIDPNGPVQQGSLFFTVQDTSSTFQDVWYGQAQTNSTTATMSLCVVPVCNCPPVCIQQVPLSPGAYTLVLCDSTSGIEEQQIPIGEPINAIDVFGNKSDIISNKFLILIYADGSRKKVFIAE